MNSWEAEKQRWDPSAELNRRQRRARTLERRLRIAAVVLAVLAAVTIGGARLGGFS
ncbi:hypothetical protein [Streptomyces sp. AC627_RSS907]|uniref:hypothetical protein n=1 Tax=Streptomyces sp. AC627_RSS907 TaxID=2823684 RepID=UPI001C265B60|nr:hypothetical protein [Streptomyces sp. AC627_RSS907]